VVYSPGPIDPGSLKPVEHSGTQPLISLSDGDALAEGVVAAAADPGATDEAGVPPSHAVMASRTTAIDRKYRVEAWGAVTVQPTSFVESRGGSFPSQPIW